MARAFTGNGTSTSEYLNVNSSAVGASPSAVTMCYWCRPANVTGRTFGVTVTDKDDSVDYLSLWARGDLAGDPVRANAGGFGSTNVSADTTTGFSANVWHHAAATFRHAAGTTYVEVWIDGGSKGTNSNSSNSFRSLDRTCINWIGDSTPIYSSHNNEMAEVAIWNRELTDSEITSLSNGFSPLMFRSSLVAYWPLGGITKNDADKDIVGGFNMTAFNTPTTADHPPGIIYPSGVVHG